jgi:DMSO/TMAO reductase YedYZ heme-binding membrane subunit
LRQGLHQLVERLVEFLDSYILKLLRHFVHADSQFRTLFLKLGLALAILGSSVIGWRDALGIHHPYYSTFHAKFFPYYQQAKNHLFQIKGSPAIRIELVSF